MYIYKHTQTCGNEGRGPGKVWREEKEGANDLTVF